MKQLYKPIALMVLFLFCSCVQKSYNRTVLYTLKVDNIKNVQSVGVRGRDKPLNWNKDYPLTLDKKDGLYKAYVTTNTGYLFTECKFVVNGEFEFADSPNRKIMFNNRDTIVYNAVFNKEK